MFSSTLTSQRRDRTADPPFIALARSEIFVNQAMRCVVCLACTTWPTDAPDAPLRSDLYPERKTNFTLHCL